MTIHRSYSWNWPVIGVPQWSNHQNRLALAGRIPITVHHSLLIARRSLSPDEYTDAQNSDIGQPNLDLPNRIGLDGTYATRLIDVIGTIMPADDQTDL
jgi:hypothetical protein